MRACLGDGIRMCTVLALAAMAGAAGAQARAGGNGPLPGDPGYGNGGAPAEPIGEPYGYSVPPPVSDGTVASWAAVAFGTRAGQATRGYWFSGQFDTPDQANNAALKACARGGGEGCEVAETAIDGYLGVATSADGTLFANYSAENVENAEFMAVGKCQYEAKKEGCRSLEVFANPRRQR